MTRELKIAILNTMWTGDANLHLYVTAVQDRWLKSAFLTCAWFPRTLTMQHMKPFSEGSCWQMFTDICDTYKEQTVLYFPLLLRSAFNLHSDFNLLHPWQKEVVLMGKNNLQKMKFQRDCWGSHYLIFLTMLIMIAKMSDSSIIGNGQNNIVHSLPSNTDSEQRATKVTMTVTH